MEPSLDSTLTGFVKSSSFSPSIKYFIDEPSSAIVYVEEPFEGFMSNPLLFLVSSSEKLLISCEKLI